MTALAETTVYEPAPEAPHQNDAPGWGAQGSVASTGVSVYLDEGLNYNLDAEYEPGALVYSTGELTDCVWANVASTFQYYVVPARLPPSANAWGGWGFSTLTLASAWPPQPVTFGMCLVDTVQRTLPTSLEAQRRERQATARLARQIQELVPDLSEGDIAQLVGVSRVTWRDWLNGARAARRTKRQRKLRLRRILELRQRIDPDGLVSHWLDSPVGANLEVTPARLLAEGRDQLVAILAARMDAPDTAGLTLAPTQDLIDIMDLERVDEALRSRRQVYAVDEAADS
jgi:hypothetical protein